MGRAIAIALALAFLCGVLNADTITRKQGPVFKYRLLSMVSDRSTFFIVTLDNLGIHAPRGVSHSTIVGTTDTGQTGQVYFATDTEVLTGDRYAMIWIN